MSTRQKQNLKLTCRITGKSRNTNTAYLEKKAEEAGSVDEFLANYVSRPAAKLLREGKTVAEVREQLGITDAPEMTDEEARQSLEVNGKRNRQRVAVPA